MLLELVPQYLQSLDPREDRTRRMLERMGLSEEQIRSELPGASVLVTLPSRPKPAQVLLARQTVDLVVRLQPLVGRVLVDSVHEADVVGDLPNRFPLEARPAAAASTADVAVSVGVSASSHEVAIDAAGWAVAFGQSCSADDDGNPVGPLAGAALAAGDVFKLLFAKRWPDSRIARQIQLNRGVFSFWDYSETQRSPRLAPIRLDATLVGCGGVGSGVVVALGELGSALSGTLRIVDHDKLDLYNLNRVTFAGFEAAKHGENKVPVARAYLAHRARVLHVEPIDNTYAEFKRLTPRRADRRYELVLTGLDSDDARVEVQMDLPRHLVDGSTGAQLNCAVESVRFGPSGCLGCSRQPAPPRSNVHCDDPPDERAPSISFLSAFAGTLVAGEAVKISLGEEGASFGQFEHVFTYGLNPDQRRRVGHSPQCRVGCRDENVQAAFRGKWAPV